LGITIGALLPFVIFLGAAIIKILAIPWAVYAIWFLISIAIGAVPPILVYFARKEAIREFLIFEAGGFGLFSPLWLVLFTDLSGDSWFTLITDGITGGLVGPGLGGDLVPMDISNIMLVPLLLFCILVGIVFLRPSFIAKHSVKGEIAELRDLKESAEPVPEKVPEAAEATIVDPIEKDMPAVAPPKASADTMADLRGLLTELGTPEPTINLIFNAGIATTTDFVATSPDQLATLTGIDKRTAEDLHMAVQKKVWFGGL
ncbi:MAG: helix-hairpin-helix domain-containing protein, partial [Promethearchaeota archaeon]